MFIPYPLTTHHLLGAALNLTFIEKAVSREFPIHPRVLFMPFGNEKSSKAEEKVKGHCWKSHPKEESLGAVPFDTGV